MKWRSIDNIYIHKVYIIIIIWYIYTHIMTSMIQATTATSNMCIYIYNSVIFDHFTIISNVGVSYPMHTFPLGKASTSWPVYPSRISTLPPLHKLQGCSQHCSYKGGKLDKYGSKITRLPVISHYLPTLPSNLSHPSNPEVLSKFHWVDGEHGAGQNC